MSSLDVMRCTACRGGEPPLSREQIEEYLPQVPAWSLDTSNGTYRIERCYRFPDFARALAFTNKIGSLAEKEGHHPALLTEWGRVTVSWWTNKIKGLHRNDFIMAARSDKAYQELRPADRRP